MNVLYQLDTMLKKIQLWILPKRLLIVGLWRYIHILVFLLGIGGLIAGVFVPSIRFVLLKGGSLWAQLSVLLLSLALLPGILGRLQWLKPLVSIIMPFRRHIGISMFLSGFNHYLWTTLLVDVVFQQVLWDKPVYVLMGAGALGIASLLFLTSNDWSVKHLGRQWKKLQQLVYLVLLFLLIHLTLQLSKWSLVAGLLLLGEIVSFIVAQKRKVETLQS